MTELLDTSSSEKIRDLIESANNIAVIPSKVAGANSYCAAVGLYQMLSEAEKRVSFIYPGKVPDICENMLPKEQIVSEVGARELVVSIDYANTNASKVHYATVDDVLTLRVSPVDRNFDLSRVKARLSGANYDLVFTVGVNEPYDLTNLQGGLSESVQNAKVINIDNTERNVKFGTVNVVDVSSSSLAMVIYKHAITWGLLPGDRSAKALLTGMTYREKGVDK